MSDGYGADVDLDHETAYRTQRGYSHRVLHADPGCKSLGQAHDVIEVDPEHYRPAWDWCRRCSDAPTDMDPQSAGEQNTGTNLADKLSDADSLDDLREGQA